MNGKLRRFAAVLLPFCFVSAEKSTPPASPQVNREGIRQPSPETLRRASEDRQRMRAHAVAINDLAGHIQSINEARKLVDLVAAEFSKSLPPQWVTRSIRDRIARAEYAAAADPGSLIPEQRVADAWNDYLQEIGAPQESFVTAAEIHTLRDSYYTSSQVSWARGEQNIWTVPNIYALGADGKVANGCRALEVLNVLWQLANQPEILQGTRELIKKGERLSDIYKNPSKPPTPGSEQSFVTFRMAPPNPVEQAAAHYIHDHGARAFNNAVDGLLNALFEG